MTSYGDNYVNRNAYDPPFIQHYTYNQKLVLPPQHNMLIRTYTPGNNDRTKCFHIFKKISIIQSLKN